MKRTLSLFLAIVMVMLCIPMTAVTATEDEVPEEYIPVRTVEDLYNVRNDLTANYIMMNDIDLTEATAEGGDWDNGGNGWDPISGTFFGIFDGNDHSIIGMRMSNTSGGLFSSVSGIITDLTMVDVNISGGDTVGALAGSSSGATIENCHIYGSLTRTKTNLGGFIGTASNTTFTLCSNHATVNGGAYVGGIVGQVDSVSIEYCYNAGDITTNYNYGYYYYDSWHKLITGTYYDYYWENYGGGITAKGSSSVISNCYNLGSVTGKTTSYSNTGSYHYNAYCAGIIYSDYGANTIGSCYNIGTVSTTNSSTPIYNISGPHSTISSSYYLGTSGSSYTGAKSLTEAQMKLQSMYSGFDFENTWFMINGGEYPYPQLRDNPQNLLEQMDNIAIYALPEKQVCRLDETPSFEGGKILVTYVSGNTEVIDITADMVTGIDTSAEGKYTATVTFRGCTDTFDFYVVSADMTGLSLIAKPATTVYLEGDELNLAGMVVCANFADGAAYIINDYTVGGYDSTPGTKNVTITFNGYEASFDVEVTAKTLVSVKLTALPEKTVYLEGDELDMTGAVLTAYYNNNTSAEVTDYTISGYDSTPGEKTVVLTYNEKTVSFKVTVEAKVISGIEVTTLPAKVVYLEGDNFDPVGMIVTAYYDNGTSGEITDYEITGYDSTPGDKTIIIKCGDCTASFDVKVTAKSLTSIAVTNLPRKTVYLEGDKLDTVGLEITAYYNNGTSEVITGYELIGFTSVPGVNTIAVSYMNRITTFTVTVIAKSMTEIVVAEKPVKLVYLEGDIFDDDGLKVIAKYDNNTEKEVLDYTVSGYDSTPGTKFITVSYNGFEAQFTVEVIASVITEIKITNLPSKLTYYVGEELNTAGLVVTAFYDNGTTKVLEKDQYSIKGFDSSAAGINDITVFYDDMTQSFSVTIIEVDETIVLGDVDGDGVVNIVDVSVLSRYLSGGDVYIAGTADINNDGKILINDLSILKRFISGGDL